MFACRAQDNEDMGAPNAWCFFDDAIRLLAPQSCVPIAGSAPPRFAFHRHDYFWLAMSLSACDSYGAYERNLEAVFVGIHSLGWHAMHDAVARAMALGFAVPRPTDISHAVRSALIWSLGHKESLRQLSADDFQLMPHVSASVSDSWWLRTSYAAWLADGLFQPLCHMLGCAGQFWEAASRATDSRLHLSFLLTQEFLPVPPNLPLSLHGDSAVEFYVTTMPPPQLLYFPSSIARLRNALMVRWGYHHGGANYIPAVLAYVIPVMLHECSHLSRFLNPAPNVASQISAYRMIACLLSPASEPYKYETILHVDQRLALYLSVAAQADAMSPPAYAEARAFLLQGAVERERSAVQSAPSSETSSARSQAGGPATRRIITSLIELRSDPMILQLESNLQQAWSSSEHRPVEVYRLALESKSATCIAILFENLVGVRDVGPIFDILEQAASERLNYFSYRLSTPDYMEDRPDHTLWFHYPAAWDACLRSPDFSTFAKLNLFELGSQIRKLRKQIDIRPQDSPKPGQEFLAGLAGYHLSLLGHLSVWLEVLGCTLSGSAGFEEAYREFLSYSQHGVLYTGTQLEGHVLGMQKLFLAFQQDLHQAFKCFWNRRPQDYGQLVSNDVIFTQTGRFHGILRQVMADVNQVNDLSRLGVSFESRAGDRPAKRARLQDAASSSNALALVPYVPPRVQPAQPARPAAARGLGTFSWAVKDEGETLLVGRSRYAKQPILEKLGLDESQICLPSFLSWKGTEACHKAGLPGHETAQSAAHVFSDEVQALRQALEQSPFRVWSDPQQALVNPSGRARGGSRIRGRGRGGQAAADAVE